MLALGCAPSLKTQLLHRIKHAREADAVEVAFIDVATGEAVGIDDRELMHAGSTMKLPVMMEIYRLVAAQRLALDQPITVINSFHSIVDNSEYTLDAGDDGDAWMYTQLGHDVPLSKLVERMIVRSSNLATNLLIERVGASNVTRLCRELGASDMVVRRGVEDGKAYRAGLNNMTTAHDLQVLLEAIYRHRVPGADEMLTILAQQEFNEGIPVGLPPHTEVAHKTGSIERFYHDAAIVNPRGPHPYVLVVMTRGPTEKLAPLLVADLSRIVYRHVVTQGQ
jgi:beta-lactamase class A